MHYLTTRTVAFLLNCTQRNICYLVKANKITPAITLENGHFLFTEKELKRFNNSKKKSYAK